MDRYEYKLKLDRLKSLVADESYEEAAQIADSINWRKIKNVNVLMKIGEIYEKVGRYEESRDVFLMAYDRSPIGRMIIFRLAQIALKMGNYDDANDYYQEFVNIAPHDTLKYVLKYQIAKAKGEHISEQIAILEELKEQEYSEEWSYELAYLYYKAAESEKCIETCDELILWFGDGPYVEQALELKMKFQPLTKEQEEKYRQFSQQKKGIIEVRPEDHLESGEIVHEPVQIPNVKLSPDRFNTRNLQAEIQKNIAEIMQAKESENVDGGIDNRKQLSEDVSSDTKKGPTPDTPKTNVSQSLNRKNIPEFIPVPEKERNTSAKAAQDGIDSMLQEWENTRRAAEAALAEKEQQELEETKIRALQEAGDIMESLADVIPKLDAELTPQDLMQQQYAAKQEMPEERAAAMVANMNQILQKQIDKLENENAKPDREIAVAGINGNAGRTPTSDRIPGFRQGIPGTVMPEGFHVEETKPRVSVLKNEKLQEIWPVIKRPEKTAKEKAPLQQESLQDQVKAAFDKSESLAEFRNQILQGSTVVSETANAPAYNMQPAMQRQEILRERVRQQSEKPETVQKRIPKQEPAGQEVVQQPEIPQQILRQEPAGQEVVQQPGIPQRILRQEPAGQEVVQQPEIPQQILRQEMPEAMATQVVGVRELLPEAELPEISLPEDLEDLEEKKKPDVTLTVLPEIKPVMPTTVDLEKAIQKEAARGIPTEAFANAALPKIAEPEEDVAASVYTKLSGELREIFSYFVFIRGMEQQICQAMTGAVRHLMVRKNSSIGNMLIQGGQGSGKTVLAGNMLKALQKETGKLNGKIGKIEAAALNQKYLPTLMKKVAGGCLIIEKAGEISKETAAQMGKLLAADESGLFVIMEDTYQGIEKALGQDTGFAARFSEKVNIPIFTSDDLVTFAKSYANEMGYTIDEMGILALYNSISSIQKLDHVTTLTEVKEIVDEAIVKVEQGGLKKVFSIIASTRYDQEDYVILHEKDFVF